MTFLDIINKKKKAIALNRDECFWFINNLVNNNITDYQTSALIMAFYINDMTDDEMIWITEAILDNSEKIEAIASNKLGLIIDKHSSGGIGDKVSLIISPILAAIGYDVIKLSGRGLSYTGGTIDKLESIGILTEYNSNTFNDLLKKANFLIMLQNEKLVQADKKMYALRNAIGTVDSFKLIAISIMCKKLIVNSDYIFLDIKIGDGAFCKTIEDGELISSLMVKIAKHFNRKIVIFLTNMNQPLGHAIGNAIEIKESVNFLKNKFDSLQLKNFIYDFCAEIMLDTKICESKQEAIKKIDNVIQNNIAYQYFDNYAKNLSDNYKLFEEDKYFNPKYKVDIYAEKDGFISIRENHSVGLIANALGAGRIKKESSIDMQAGIQLHFDPYSKVSKNECIATLYSSNPISDELINNFKDVIQYDNKVTNLTSLIIKKIY